jgi:tetratricopeptide (TPR) repeat protein
MSRTSMHLTAGLALGAALFSAGLWARDLELDETDPDKAAASDVDLVESHIDNRTVSPQAAAPPVLFPTHDSEPEFEPMPNDSGSDSPGSDNSESSDAEAPEAASARKAGKPQRGEALVRLAFEMSKTAKTEHDFSQIIELCHRGLDVGIKGAMLPYAPQLMAWSHNRRGEVRADADRSDEAQRDFIAAVKLDNSKWRYIHNRGVGFALLGKYEAAIADFNQTIRMNPRYANAYFNRGELRYEKQDFVGAIEDYTQAIRLAPADASAFNSRGHAHYRLEQFRDALADYNEAVRLDPENAAAYTNRGDAYADLGQYPEAAHDYQAAIKLNPKLARALQSAAWLMATCPNEAFRNEQLALGAAKKAIELEGEHDYRFVETLAAAQASAGDFKSAVETQKKVVALVSTTNRERAENRLKLFQERTPYRELPREVAPPPAARQVRRPNPPGRTTK